MDLRSTADKRALEILNETTNYEGTRHKVDMVWVMDDALSENVYAA